MESVFYFERYENKYKIYHYGNSKISVNFSVLLRGIEVPVQTIRYDFSVKGEWFVPYLDYTGVSKLEIRDRETGKLLIEKIIDKTLSERAKGQNIICVGLNKSGTSSFTKAMTDLGYKMFPEPNQFQLLVSNAYHNDWFSTLSVLNNPRFNLFNDAPFSYPGSINHIYPNRPNDIYVLTVRRTEEDWFKSVFNNEFIKLNKDSPLEDCSVIHTQWENEQERLLKNQLAPMFEAWGIKDKENLKEKLITCYNRHIEDTINFFKHKQANFKVIDVSQPDELQNFCNWLGIESPSRNFPWENKAK